MMLLNSDDYSWSESSSSDESENDNEMSQNSSVDSQADNKQQDIIPPSPKGVKLSKTTNLNNNIQHVTSAHNHDKSQTFT